MNQTRLKEIAKNLGVSDSKLSNLLGKSDSYIRTMSGNAGSDVISEILRKFPDINPYWLILGKGDIYDKPPVPYTNTTQNTELSEPTMEYKKEQDVEANSAQFQELKEQLEFYKEMVSLLKEDIKQKNELIQGFLEGKITKIDQK